MVTLLRPWTRHFYDDYLCLVASNKQQIQRTRIRKNQQEHWIIGISQAGADFSNHEVVNAMKMCGSSIKLPSDAVR